MQRASTLHAREAFRAISVQFGKALATSVSFQTSRVTTLESSLQTPRRNNSICFARICNRCSVNGWFNRLLIANLLFIRVGICDASFPIQVRGVFLRHLRHVLILILLLVRALEFYVYSKYVWSNWFFSSFSSRYLALHVRVISPQKRFRHHSQCHTIVWQLKRARACACVSISNKLLIKSSQWKQHLLANPAYFDMARLCTFHRSMLFMIRDSLQVSTLSVKHLFLRFIGLDNANFSRLKRRREY